MLILQDVKPLPLATSGLIEKSQTWGAQVKFEKGKKYLISAPSGRGKSTLIHLLYGIRQDYEGEAFLDEQNLRDLPPDIWADLRQKQLAIVFQDLRLFPELTALENIMLKATLTGYKSQPEIEAMAKQLGIVELLSQNCGSLSYGQQQRVAIIRALCQPFDFLLLDEPFSHLDDENTQLAGQLIAGEVDRQQAGMLLVSLGERYYFEYDVDLLL